MSALTNSKLSKLLRRWNSLIILCFMALNLTACTAVLVGGGAAAGIGTYRYIKGELRTHVSAPLNRTTNAAMNVVNNMGFDVNDYDSDTLSSKIIAKKADGTDVIIKIYRVENDITKIKVRVGLWGNEAESRLIMDAIRKKL
ncbi:MAG: DUF3568 family protein [Chlamydiota bacterium]